MRRPGPLCRRRGDGDEPTAENLAGPDAESISISPSSE
jgi:hypothetical protein